ncbi:uncharacterized protein FOMMEDRAFT_150187 [Fomitiporia mediterranea MF3/22]|uniref:uncharacterized protein n=1 Tax=Fomitiporia mediterranea (strain MF3/22) TaxID=694068 RepID=UPI0004409C30|nr:uncharacterized protein FOMMEDRAFT_150187 [Fomitiporia mediterranea MF3/22]EJD07645.1 hypothetical protein FOMMEDRAFT_150187 [Fomitiporia mediterranea MF3/22]
MPMQQHPSHVCLATVDAQRIAIMNAISRYLAPPILSDENFEQTLRQVILVMVTVLILLLGNSMANYSTFMVVAECLMFHSMMSIILYLNWPNDNIYLTLRRSDVGFPVKLVLSYSSTPLLVVARILFITAVKLAPTGLSFTITVFITTAHLTTLFVLRPPQLLIIAVYKLLPFTIVPVIRILKTARGLFSSLASGSMKLLGISIGRAYDVFQSTNSAIRVLLSHAYRITICAAQVSPAFIRIFYNKSFRTAEMAASSFLRSLLACARCTMSILSWTILVVGLTIGSLGNYAVGLLFMTTKSAKCLVACCDELLKSSRTFIVNRADTLLLFSIKVAIRITRQIISSILSLCVILWRLWNVLFKLLTNGSRKPTKPDAGLLPPAPPEESDRLTKVFGITFVSVLSVLLVYRMSLQVLHHRLKQIRASDCNVRSHVHHPTETSEELGLLTRMRINNGHDEQYRDHPSLLESPVSDSHDLALGTPSLIPDMEVEFDKISRAEALPCAIDRKVTGMQENDTLRAQSLPEVRSAELTTKNEDELHTPTVIGDLNTRNKTIRASSNSRRDFWIAAHCAAAAAPRFTTCKGFKQVATDTRRIYGTQIAEFGVQIHSVEERVSRPTIGSDEEYKHNLDSHQFFPAHAHFLARGLEVARLQLMHGEEDIRESARVGVAEQARNTYLLQHRGGARHVYQRLYDGDLDLISFLDLEPNKVTGSPEFPSPLLLPPCFVRGELEAELDALDLMQKASEDHFDGQMDLCDRDIRSASGMIPSPSDHERYTVSLPCSFEMEEQRVNGMIIRRELVREGMKGPESIA